MSTFELNADTAKIVYSWFHMAYPEWKTNEWCTNEHAMIMRDLEEFILNNENR